MLSTFNHPIYICIGMWLLSGNWQEKINWLKYVFWGFGYILLTGYTAYQPKILTYWTSTSFLTSFWFMPCISRLLKAEIFRCAQLESIGKASFHIFLTQMVFFDAAFDNICRITSARAVQLLLFFSVSIIVGMAFYYAESYLTNYIFGHLKDCAQISLETFEK